MVLSSRSAVVVALGITQTLAWASSYYLPAMLAAPMAKDLGIETPTVFAAFSFALVISAFLGPYAGRAIDRWGGRPVLMATNLVFAAGLMLLGTAHSLVGLLVAWAVLGVGMGSGLYEAAFAGLVRLYGRDSRGAITGITLLAGFASTVGWPLSAFLEARYGWRGACFGWAALHVFLGLPLNWLLPKAATVAATLSESPGPATPVPNASSPLKAPILLSVVFAITWFISTAMAAHLPRLLMPAAPHWRLPSHSGPWSGRRRSERGYWSSAFCARCTHCFQQGWRRWCILPALRCWASLGLLWQLSL